MPYKTKSTIIVTQQHKNTTLSEYRGNDWEKVENAGKKLPKLPDPYGIKLGQTSENSIRFKYDIKKEFTIDEYGRPQGTWLDPYFHLFRQSDNPEIFGAPNLKVLILDGKPFSKGDLPVERVSVSFDENKKVNFVSVVYPRRMDTYIKSMLDKKYQQINDKSWGFWNRYKLYKAPGALVGLFLDPRKEDETQGLSFWKSIIATDALTTPCIAINYCTEELMNKYKQWLKERDQQASDLL